VFVIIYYAFQIFRPLPGAAWLLASPLKGSDLAFESDRHIEHVPIPITILHNTRDFVVRYSLGKQVGTNTISISTASHMPLLYLKLYCMSISNHVIYNDRVCLIISCVILEINFVPNLQSPYIFTNSEEEALAQLTSIYVVSLNWAQLYKIS